MSKWPITLDCPPSSRRYRGGWLSYQCRRLPFAALCFILGMLTQAVHDMNVIAGILGLA